MGIGQKILAAFAITSSIAGLLAFILDPHWAFVIWLAIFLSATIYVVSSYSWAVVRIIRGYNDALDFLSDIIEQGRNEYVFIYAAYNITEEMRNHKYFRKTEDMITKNAFNDYTRVVVLGTKADVDMTADFLRRFYRVPKFKLGVYERSRAFFINILAISPSTTMLPQLFVNGLIAGSIYALVALGFGLIYSTTRFFHFAHGMVLLT